MIKEAGQGTTDPAIHYKEKIASGVVPAALEARLKPRNPRQVKNAQSAVRRVQRYTQDDLFNLVELAYDLKRLCASFVSGARARGWCLLTEQYYRK